MGTSNKKRTLTRPCGPYLNVWQRDVSCDIRNVTSNMVYIITVMMLISLTSQRKTLSLSSHHGVNGGLGEVYMFQATWKQFVSVLRTSHTSLACHNRHEFTHVCVNSGYEFRKNCRLCIYIKAFFEYWY